MSGEPDDPEFYETLRGRLTDFFRWRKCPDPEDLAAETVVRGLAQIAKGAQIRTTVVQYFFGIAKHLVAEQRRPQPPDPPDPTPAPDWHRLTDIERKILVTEALGQLSPEDRKLVIRYHTEDRQALAVQLGISNGALRVRVHRLHQRLSAMLNLEPR